MENITPDAVAIILSLVGMVAIFVINFSPKRKTKK